MEKKKSLKKKGFLALFVLFSVFFAVSGALACRIDVMKPPQIPYMQQIQTREHNVSIAIKNQQAEITVQATFYNPNNTDLEGEYWFPLYEDSAVSSFMMMVNGKEMQAELLDSKQARDTYEAIVRQMKDPALLEFVGMRMLRQRVYPIKAHSEVRIFLKYSQLLSSNNGTMQLKYPLSSAKPANGNIGKLNITAYIEADTPIKNIYSSSHSISTDKKSDKAARLNFTATNYMPDKPFTLYYSLDKKDIGVSLITHKTGKEDGYFTLLVSPQVEYKSGRVVSKDFIFVMDTSGSMAGNKIEGARQALLSCLNTLNKTDRFNIINFNSYVDPLQEKLLDATEANISEARSFVNRLASSGSTDINSALQAALGMLNVKDSRMPVIVFLTDGQPTVGEQNIQAILKNTKAGNAKGARVFVFGVGTDVNTELLDKLADENSGSAEYVSEDKTSIEETIGALASKISNPVLSNVKVDFGGMKVYDMFPRVMPDIFRGSQLVITGRYAGSGDRTVTISGVAADEKKEYASAVNFKDSSRDVFVQRFWAIKKVAYLMDEINLKGANKEIENEIRDLGKKFGIVTPYTSFLITEDNLRNTSMGNRPEEAVKMDMSDAKTGGFAVTRSKALSKAKKSADMDSAAGMMMPSAPSMETEEGRAYQAQVQQAIVHAGGKTFVKDTDGYYKDTEYDAGTDKDVITVAYMSDGYFELVNKYPELAEYFSAAERIIVKFQGKVYKVTQ